MKEYWNNLTKSEQLALARHVGSSTEYLRLVFNGYKKAGFSLAKRLEGVTQGGVTKNQLRPDIYENFTIKLQAEELPIKKQYT
ncbi:YdaS family helix-turn-helix protein [Candidatus Fukatsuia symbiotica]|uniref:Transcriptional regulator n=1 Tax=Candidatus Fukatsuia symbiotica TaxID=1878942 RepID=A0A2Y9CKC6_9GAMM|nr:YdaS family helix-turn-helix protein [Candidatus Fukatsuia symbiotica]AWK13300.1 transcriptional regulator [Candidatus Fukatsuia symbiotica]MEA9444175.1 YdaS family helix-turn-helix protein [Candidatus Fukatsuia symbiotica]